MENRFDSLDAAVEKKTPTESEVDAMFVTLGILSAITAVAIYTLCSIEGIVHVLPSFSLVSVHKNDNTLDLYANFVVFNYNNHTIMIYKTLNASLIYMDTNTTIATSSLPPFTQPGGGAVYYSTSSFTLPLKIHPFNQNRSTVGPYSFRISGSLKYKCTNWLCSEPEVPLTVMCEQVNLSLSNSSNHKNIIQYSGDVVESISDNCDVEWSSAIDPYHLLSMYSVVFYSLLISWSCYLFIAFIYLVFNKIPAWLANLK